MTRGACCCNHGIMRAPRPHPWLASLPLMSVGAVLAHSASYRIVAADRYEHARLLADSGHGHPTFGPLLLAGLLTLTVVGLGAVVVEGARQRELPRNSSWLFGALPLLGFAVQEHFERMIHDGHFPVAAALEPTFLVGIVLQTPFAIAALLLARFVAQAAYSLGRLLAPRVERRRVGAPVARLATARTLPRIRPLAAGHAGRGPPLLAVA